MRILMVFLLANVAHVSASVSGERYPAATSGLFDRREIIEMTMESSYQKLFEEAQIYRFTSGSPIPGEALKKEEPKEPEADVKISYVTADGRHLQATGKVHVRGNTSQTECQFPKLKVELDAKSQTDLFAGVEGFKLNTHCGDEEGRTQLGRLVGEKSPMREGLAYEWGAALKLPISFTRRARIKYVDTGSNETIVKHGLIIEAPGATAKRLGGKRFKGDQYTSEVLTTVDADVLARLYLFENLVGNWDWHFKIRPEESTNKDDVKYLRSRLWNVDVITFNNGRELPMPYDFDMASLTTGHTRLTQNFAQTKYLAGESPLKRYMGFEILFKSRLMVERSALLKALEDFRLLRPQLETLATQPFLDREGVRNAKAHLEAFYSLVDKASFSYPMIVRRTEGKSDTGSQAECLRLHAGSPVRILGQSGNLINIEYQGLGCDLPSLWVPADSVEIPKN